MIPATISIDPTQKGGKRLIKDLAQSLPYELSRVAPDCGHNPFYIIQLVPEQPLLCGLCFFRDGVEGEIPDRIHQFKTLAENGNPETAPKLMAHLHTVMGLKPPKPGESLQDYRKRRTALARGRYSVRNPWDHSKIVAIPTIEKYSSPSPRLFPVTSALWKLMGYQPLLGIVLIEGVAGRTENEIARKLGASVLDIYSRMVKAIRIGTGFIPNDDSTETSSRSRGSSRECRSRRSEEAGTHESWSEDPES